MEEFFNVVVEKINESENIIQLLIFICTGFLAYTAHKALNGWKLQALTDIQIKFLDKLCDTLNEFILEINIPITHLNFLNLEIDIYLKDIQNKEDQYEMIKSLLENPQKLCSRKELREALNKIRPLKSQLDSLINKGQALGIKNYFQVFNHCNIISSTYNQIESISSILQNKNLFWDNPEIKQVVENLLLIRGRDLTASLEQQQSAFLAFYRDHVKRLAF